MKLWTIIKGGIAASGLVALLALPTVASANCNDLVNQEGEEGEGVGDHLRRNFDACSEFPRSQCLACCANALARWQAVSGLAQACENQLVVGEETVDRLNCKSFQEGQDLKECTADANADQKDGVTGAREERISQRDEGTERYQSCRDSCPDSGE